MADIVRDINKYSNNVMARQVFLSLSNEVLKQPASGKKSEQVVKEWLKTRNIPAADVVLENGSGLSRIERSSARTLVSLLQSAYKSPVFGELVASLPAVGVDGTLKKRLQGAGVAGNAHIKGGTLTGVRAIAGYVLAADGKRYALALLINHSNAGNSQAAQDALLAWVYAQPNAR